MLDYGIVSQKPLPKTTANVLLNCKASEIMTDDGEHYSRAGEEVLNGEVRTTREFGGWVGEGVSMQPYQRQ